MKILDSSLIIPVKSGLWPVGTNDRLSLRDLLRARRL